MKIKILCLVLIATVLCSFFVLSASAEDEFVIEAGTYKWDDELPPFVPDADYTNDFPILLSTPVVTINIEGTDFVLGGDFLGFHFGGLYYDELSYIETYNPPSSVTGTVFYTPSDGWNVAYNLLKELGTDDPSLKGLGQTFTIAEDTVVDATIYTYFVSHTSSVSNTISSGYYRLVLPIDVTNPSWIGSGNTVWYNMRGRVITDNSNRAFSFYRLGFRYNSWEASADRGAGWSLDVLINDAQHDDLEILDFTYFADSGQFYWMYNDLVLDSFAGLAIDGDYEVDNDLYGFFTELFEPYEYVYTGNPWYDIVDGVVDALKIDVFGSFSPWDILVTFIGISVFIWLLKLLAGG